MPVQSGISPERRSRGDAAESRSRCSCRLPFIVCEPTGLYLAVATAPPRERAALLLSTQDEGYGWGSEPYKSDDPPALGRRGHDRLVRNQPGDAAIEVGGHRRRLRRCD